MALQLVLRESVAQGIRASLILLGLATAGCSDPGASNPDTASLSLASADGGDAQALEMDIFHRRVPASGPPQAFVISADVDIAEQEFLDSYAATLWGLTDKDAIVPGGAPLQDGEYQYQVYVQKYAGFPVAGGSLVLTSRNGHLVAGIGDFVGHLDSSIGAVELLDGKVKKVGVHHGRAKQLAFDEVSRSLGLTKPVAVLEQPHGEIVLSRNRVAWRFLFKTKAPFTERMVDIDADNGAVLVHQDLLFGVWQPTAVPAVGLDYDGDPLTADGELTIFAEVESDAVAAGDPKARMRYAPLDMAIYDSTNLGVNQLFTNLVDFTSPDPKFDDPFLDHVVTTMWAMESSAHYLIGLLGLNGLDGAGAGVNAHMNVPISTPGNAPGYSAIHNVILIPPNSTHRRYDVLAHEVAHSVQTQLERSVGILPVATTEKAALWESYGDIFGMAVEEQITGVLSDWTIGQPVIRRLDDPTASVPPQSVLYGDAAFNAGDQYTRAGVQTRWFHLLATGGTPPVAGVKGVGVEEARRVALGAMVFNKPTDYLQAVEASLQQASQTCGAHTQLWVSVSNAWYHVGAGTQAFYSEPFVSPADAATEVRPWPTTLSWSGFENEGAWEIDIDTVDTFDSGDRRGPLAVTGTPGGLVTTDLNLRPGTRYFWRVRANLPESTGMGCWREVHSFTTSELRPELGSPTTGDGLHPWELDFEWTQAAGGAVGSDLTIRVAGRPEYTKQVPPCTACTDTENLPVDKEFTWSVRAKGPTDLYSPNESARAESATLHTSLPESGFVSRTGGPWPATLEWEEVPGASGYAASVWTSYGEEIWNTDQTFEVGAQIYLDPNTEHYELRIEPIGPDSVLGDEGAQDRGRSTTDPFELPHEVAVAASVNTTEPNIFTTECRTQGRNVTVTWNQVDGAEYYIIRVFEIEFAWPSGTYDTCHHTDYVTEYTVNHQPGLATASYDVPAYRGGFETVLGAGYVVDVTGYSPGGQFDSWCGGFAESTSETCSHDACERDGWVVQPKAPVPIAPLDGWVQEGSHTTLEWSYTLANGGSFYLETYNGHNCDGPYTWRDTGAFDSVSGIGTYEMTWGEPGWPDDGENVAKSWRVRPTGVYEPCDQSAHWSPCQGITVRSSCGSLGENCCESGDECEGNLLCDGGVCNTCGPEGHLCCGPEQGVACGTGLECQAGRCERRADLIACGEPVVFSGGRFAPPPQQIDLRATKGRFWFGFDTVTIPDKITVYRDGQVVAGTAMATNSDGCVGTAGGMFVDLDEGSSLLTVYVEPNCEYTGDTVWAYMVSCVNENSAPNAGPE